MTYRAPVNDIMHALKSAAGLDGLIASGIAGVDEDTVRAVIEEAGKFGAEVLDPLSAVGDRAGSKLVDGKVVTPPGWKEAYAQFAEAGWGALPCPEEFGGQGLPQMIATATGEIWNSANLAFGLCPLLTQGAIDAIEAQGSDELKRLYLSKMVSGEWTGTMNLTEPQAGSDLSALKTRAEKHLRRVIPSATIIRPGGLRSEPPTGRGILTQDPQMHGFINRDDVAELVARARRSGHVRPHLRGSRCRCGANGKRHRALSSSRIVGDVTRTSDPKTAPVSQC